MKILVISTCYPRRDAPSYGIFIHRQIRALCDLGADCRVLQPVNWSPPTAGLAKLKPDWMRARAQSSGLLNEIEGVRVYHPRVFLPFPSRFFPGDYWTRVGQSLTRYVINRADLRGADLIYAHFLCHEGYAGLFVKDALKLPLVAIARGDDVHGWVARWADRKPKLAAVMRRADGLLACSHALARDAEQLATDGLNVPFEVVYNGIETDVFKPAKNAATRRALRANFKLPPDAKLLLCVATPIVAKGWLDLLSAFAAARRANSAWQLVMVGTPRGADDLDLLVEARAYGLESKAHWLGAVDAAAMPDLYRAVDAFALASHNEGLSNSVLEAMASELPVIATNVGGHAEVITDGISGRLVAPQDIAAFTAALVEIMNDENRAAEFGVQGRRRAIAHGDYRANALKLLEYFQRLKARTEARQS